jgi:hypothetical protein
VRGDAKGLRETVLDDLYPILTSEQCDTLKVLKSDEEIRQFLDRFWHQIVRKLIRGYFICNSYLVENTHGVPIISFHTKSYAMPYPLNVERVLLRHVLATMVYRATKAIRDVPPGFGAFRASPGSRTPVEILTHISDLCEWAFTLANGKERWRDAIPQPWESELARFYTSVRQLDEYLAGPSPLSCSVERLIQGPMADAISHVGQLAMLRRLFGAPIRGENYFKADIRIGQIGPVQPPPKNEFD